MGAGRLGGGESVVGGLWWMVGSCRCSSCIDQVWFSVCRLRPRSRSQLQESYMCEFAQGRVDNGGCVIGGLRLEYGGRLAIRSRAW